MERYRLLRDAEEVDDLTQKAVISMSKNLTEAAVKRLFLLSSEIRLSFLRLYLSQIQVFFHATLSQEKMS
jgi:hypothetical protein